MTQSFWQHKPWSMEWGTAEATTTLSVQLHGSYNLRKLLIHQTFLQGWSSHSSPTTVVLIPYVSYTVEWFAAGMDQRRIFGAKYRIPSAITTFRPAGGSTDAFFQTHSAGDREIGIDQKYNYGQGDDSGIGAVVLSLTLINGGDSGDVKGGFWEGVFSVLGQR